MPLDQDRIAENRRKFKEAAKNKKDSKSSKDKDDTNRDTSPSTNNDADLTTTPPKPGAKCVRVIGGRGSEKIVYWCENCGKWGDHLTKDHPTQENTANVSTDTSTSRTTPPPSSSQSSANANGETATYASMVGGAVRSSITRPDF